MNHSSLFCFLLVMITIVKPLLNCGKFISKVSKKLSFDLQTCESKNILASVLKVL